MKYIGEIIFGFGVIVILSLVLVTSSCKKDSTPSKVNTSDANALQSVLTIPNGTLTKGSLPSTSSSSNAPQISNYQPSASTSAGYQLLLPFQYTSNNGWKYIYLQVTGATNGYFLITNPSSSTNSGTIVIPINIPASVLNGTFSIDFSVVDIDGLISTYQQTYIVIKDAMKCSDAYNSGSEGLTFTHVDLGSTGGIVSIEYDTYSVPDRIDVFQGTTWMGGTGTDPGSLIPPLCDCDTPLPGFVGEYGTIDFNYNPSKGRIITIVVSGCLGSGTAWDWSLTCP